MYCIYLLNYSKMCKQLVLSTDASARFVLRNASRCTNCRTFWQFSWNGRAPAILFTLVCSSKTASFDYL